MRQFNCVTESIYRAERVTSRAKRDDLCLVRDQPLEVAPIELPSLSIHLRDVECDTSLDYQSLPRRDVRMMFEFGDHHFIARSQRTSQRARQVIDHRGRIRPERDLACLGI